MERKYFIDNIALKRLLDPQPDIRKRTLREVAAVLKNNILFARKDPRENGDELTVVSLDILTRHLIRWFQFRPILYEDEVLDLLHQILSRKDFLRHIAKHISVARLKKEFQKISKLLLSSDSYRKLEVITQILTDYEEAILVDIANATGSFSEVDSPSYSGTSSNKENSLIDRMRRLEAPSKASSVSADCKTNCDEVLEKEFWEKLDGFDLDTFNGIDAELNWINKDENLNNVLNFLSSSIYDYPPEFFLQPPNILESLVSIIHKVSNDFAVKIVKLIRIIVNGLTDRCLASLVIDNQKQGFVPVQSNISTILQALTDYFERFHDSFNPKFFRDNQEVLNEIYLLLFDIAEFIRKTNNVCQLNVNNFMNMIALVAKDLRLCYATAMEHSGVVRLHYLISIYILNVLVATIDTKQISDQQENNAWEFECDVALLDVPLKIAHSGVYSLIKQNRKDVIKIDEDLSLMLNSQKSWTPTVRLFQDWETLDDKTVVFKGLEALSTVRFHQNPKFVSLLLVSIDNCSEELARNKKLEKAAQMIYLRLLSIEVKEIRRLAYSIARKYVEKQLQNGDFNDPAERSKEINLYSVFGIPITNEIVTEILCFGYTDSDSVVRGHSEVILFALLRSKITCNNHWIEILNIIRPVLPLITCLFSIDEKMGFFSIDIFHQHSGLSTDEIDRAFARYLYCSHPQAREIAKTKLLESFQYSQEMIDIVPENFCIIPTLKVSDLFVPEPRIGYDIEAYKRVCETLKSMDRSNCDLLKSVMLQLSVMMNSKELCLKSHNDNLWIFFMAPLDMGFPNNDIIRKLTINIILKWAVCIPDFRMYLANEAKGLLRFLVTTLIYFQEDLQIKIQTSWLLFLLLFNDFIVSSERGVSMPNFLSALNCPFKTEYHWTESPFNQISALEHMDEVMATSTEAKDIYEVSDKFHKFTFALEWFKSDRKLLEMSNFSAMTYYENLSVKTFKVSPKLQLRASDIECLKQTSSRQILKSLCNELENATVVQHAQNLIYQIQNILIIPVGFEEGMAEIFDKRIERLLVFSKKECQQKMLVGFLQIYQRLMRHLKDDRIVHLFNKKFIKSIIINSVVFPDEVYIEGINFIDCAVKLCSKRRTLMNELIKAYDLDHKIHLPSKIVETMAENLFDGVMKDKKWHETSKRPCVQAILNLLRNTLGVLPIYLDEAYLNELFHKLLEILMPLFRLHSNHIKEAKTVHIYSNTVKKIFSILLEISSIVKHLKLNADHYKSLMFWASGESKKYKEIPWMIIAHLTSKEENFNSFCNGLEEFCETKLLDTVMTSIMRPIKNINDTFLEQKALVNVLANILEYKKLCGIELHSIASIVNKLMISNNISALSFIIRVMVVNDCPKTVDLILNNEIISKLLHFELSTGDDLKAYQLISEQIETVITCLEHKLLQEHVATTLLNEGRISCTKMLRDSNGIQESIYKRFNHRVFSFLLAMIQSEVGLMRLCQIQDDPTTIDRLMFASHDNLRTTNHYKELKFQLSFWNSLLDANLKFNSPFIDLLSLHVLDCASGKCVFIKPTQAVENKSKHDTILEKNLKHVRFAIDLLFLQVVNLYNFTYLSKFSTEYKYELKSLCFLVIKKLTASNMRIKEFADTMNIFSIVTEKLDLSLAVTQSFRHLETTKKSGVNKTQFMIKDLCLAFKALLEWNLPLEENQSTLKNIFEQTLKINDWLKADFTLMNCFMQLIQVVAVMQIGRNCVMLEIDGTQLPKVILKKIQMLSSKPPHTPTDLASITNGIAVLKTLSRFVEVRMILKNAKLFQMLEVLNPQIQRNRKTTWDEVTVKWLEFFEFLSRFEDTECLPNHVSLLCRMFRLGNPTIKHKSLIVIRNFTMKTSIGHILLSSDDFPQTVDSILTDSKDDNEILIILQTLLNIAAKSEQSKAKLKNSPLNRKLKDQLRLLQSDSKLLSNPEKASISHLTNILIQLLYSKE